MAPARYYEPGMNFTYDKTSGKVSVAFRGRIAVLAGSFADEAEARAATVPAPVVVTAPAPQPAPSGTAVITSTSPQP